MAQSGMGVAVAGTGGVGLGICGRLGARKPWPCNQGGKQGGWQPKPQLRVQIWVLQKMAATQPCTCAELSVSILKVAE